MSDNALLSLENIRFGYAGGQPVFDGLRFSLHEGDSLGLYGPNGSGKTTLLRLMMGLETPQAGQILFRGRPVATGQDLHQLRCTIGFVLQNSDEQLFSSTVLEDVAFGPLNLGMKAHAARERALETLASIGMADFADRPVHRLSGGEKKLIAIATVLSMRPRALLLDEPTTFLDAQSRQRIIAVLQQERIGRLIVSHDKDFLRQTASRFASIENGVIRQIQL